MLGLVIANGSAECDQPKSNRYPESGEALEPLKMEPIGDANVEAVQENLDVR